MTSVTSPVRSGTLGFCMLCLLLNRLAEAENVAVELNLSDQEAAADIGAVFNNRRASISQCLQTRGNVFDVNIANDGRSVRIEADFAVAHFVADVPRAVSIRLSAQKCREKLLGFVHILCRID